MANSPTYRVKLKRRRQGKTNYYKRRELLKSGDTRLIIRRSTKNIVVQFIESESDGDKTKAASVSSQLKEFGWKLTGGNIPAAYLTGFLAGKRAQKAGVEDAILDLGLQRNAMGSRIYAALKGVIDAGVGVKANEKIFPEESIIEGSHMITAANALKEADSVEFKKRFGRYTSSKFKAEKLPDLLETVKTAIGDKN